MMNKCISYDFSGSMGAAQFLGSTRLIKITGKLSSCLAQFGSK
jgi:hypothetical protein